MRSFLITLLLCASALFKAYPQNNYRQAYVVTNNGDTLRGSINYKEWTISPKLVEFIPNATNNKIVFKAADLRGFEIIGLEKYLSHLGFISNDKIETTELTHSLDTSKRIDSLFLKVLSVGQNVSLLFNKDKIRSRYFISENGAKPVELGYHQYLNGDNNIISYTPFRDQLTYLIKKYNPKTAKIDREINRLSYNDDIVKYIRIINNDNSKTAKNSFASVRYYIGAGASYNFSTFNGPTKFNYKPDFTSISPVINFGIDLIANKHIQKSIFKIEGSVLSHSPTFTSPFAYFSSKQIIVGISPQFIYNVYNTDNLKYFIGGGIGIVTTLFTESKLVATESGRVGDAKFVMNKGDSYKSLNAGEYINNPYKLLPFNGNVQLKTGIVINKTAEVFINGTYSLNEGDSFIYKNHRLVLGFNYLF